MRRELPSDPQALLGHAGWMRALAASLLADSSAADDVVQDAWLAAAGHAPRDGAPLEPWLARVVRNFAWKRKRAEVRRADHERDASVPEPVLSPAETIERLELQRTLVEAVLALDEPYRTTVFLHYFEGRTSAEIARSQDVPAGTVRWRLQRGLEQLRVRLDGRFGARSAWGALLLPFAARHEAITIGAGTLTGASVAQGAMAMSMALKLCVGGVAGIALAGAAWWSFEQVPVEPLRTEAAVPPPVEVASTPVAPAGTWQQETSREATVETHVPVAPEAAAAEAAAPAPDPEPLAPGRVDVRFVDSSGIPQEGVRVDCPGHGSDANASSGPDGRAELTSVAWGNGVQGIDVRARHAGFAMVVLRTTVRPGELTHLGDVVLVPGVTLRGRVVDPAGIGIDGARVGVAPADLETAGSVPYEERAHRHGLEHFGRHAFAQSEANGAFAIEGVAPGPWRLWGHAEGMRYTWTEPLEIIGGRDANGLELVLEPLRTTDRIEGRVVDPAGAPVPNASLIICYQGENEGGMSSGTSSDAQGRFRIVVYVEGTYRILARDPEERFAEAAASGLRPGDLDVVLSLADKRWVEVGAKDTAGQPVHGVMLQVLELEEQWSRAWTAPSAPDEEARFEPPGFPFFLRVRAEGRRDVRMGPLDPGTLGDRIEVEFELLQRVRGLVRADSGAIAGAHVQVVRESEEGRSVKNGFAMRMDTDVSAECRTGEDGGFETGLDLESSERVFVRVLARGWATAELGPMSVAEATGSLLDVELTRGGVIEGRVLRSDGHDGAGTIVGINCGDGDAQTQRAGREGRYRFELLRPGRWQVHAREEEITPHSTSITSRDTGTPIVWNCEVFEGRTTTFDLSIDR